jgi:2-polyprenyl-3-methyl-5-hydroxy-6-metoxy-1,4-benzoquinol methylase
MPYSAPENKEYTKQIVRNILPKTVIDVGAGAGIYGEIVRDIVPNSHITAIEIWEPYIKQFNLKNKYDEVINKNINEVSSLECDLIIFGDVLEHMYKKDAIEIWNKVSKTAKYGIISIPTVHCPQGEYDNNPYEIHLEEDWTVEDVLQSFSHIVEHQVFSITSVFLAKFE